jgi:hypothetical protein
MLELPSVAKRWQILTRRELRLMDPSSESNALDAITSQLKAILLVAGCNSSQVHKMLHEKFEARLTKIVDLAMKLRIAMSEEVSSMDVFLLSPASGEAFSAATMDTDYPISDSAVKNVLCTIGLGVAVVEMERSNGDAWIRKGSGLLKPKVVFTEERMVSAKLQGQSNGVTEEVHPPRNDVDQTPQIVQGVQVEDVVMLDGDTVGDRECDLVKGAEVPNIGNIQGQMSEDAEWDHVKGDEKSNMKDQIDSNVQQPVARDDQLTASTVTDSPMESSPNARKRSAYASEVRSTGIAIDKTTASRARTVTGPASTKATPEHASKNNRDSRRSLSSSAIMSGSMANPNKSSPSKHNTSSTSSSTKASNAGTSAASRRGNRQISGTRPGKEGLGKPVPRFRI